MPKCSACGYHHPQDKSCTNKSQRLMAAAPDLLEAAIHALEVLRGREWSGIGHLRSQLEEAIAKANATTGQEEELHCNDQ